MGSHLRLKSRCDLVTASKVKRNCVRLIQQTLLQVLQPLIDPTFCDHSYGFLARFFDWVNHDILINRMGKRIDNAGVIRLVRA